MAIWPPYTPWQYTDGNVGPEPRDTPGTSAADRNILHGPTEELKALWPLTRREEGVPQGAGFTAISRLAYCGEGRRNKKHEAKLATR